MNWQKMSLKPMKLTFWGNGTSDSSTRLFSDKLDLNSDHLSLWDTYEFQR